MSAEKLPPLKTTAVAPTGSPEAVKVKRDSVVTRLSHAFVGLNQTTTSSARYAAVALLFVTVILGANFALTYYSLELVKELHVGSDGVMTAKDSNATVKTASVDTEYVDDKGLVGKDGELVRVKPQVDSVSPIQLYTKLNSGSEEVIEEALKILKSVEKIRPHARSMGMPRGVLKMARYNVNNMEVFQVASANGTDEGDELVAVAHTDKGRFVLQTGWEPVSDETYALLEQGMSHRPEGATRRSLFCCSCYWFGKRRMLNQSPDKPNFSSNKQVMNYCKPLRQTFASYVGGWSTELQAAQSVVTNGINTIIPGWFEQTSNVLFALAKCKVDPRFLETNSGKSLTELDNFFPSSHAWMNTFAMFYEFILETSSVYCPRNKLCKKKLFYTVFGRKRKFRIDDMWCLDEPSLLAKIFCQEHLQPFYDQLNQIIDQKNTESSGEQIDHVSSIFDHCGMLAAYIDEYAKYADDEDFDVCADTDEIFEEILDDAYKRAFVKSLVGNILGRFG